MADVKVDDLKDEELDDLGQEDFDRITTDEESGESILKDPPKPKEEEPPETPPKKDEEKPAEGEKPKEGDEEDKKPKEDEPKDEHAKITDDIKSLEDVPKEDRTDVQAIELSRLNAVQRMHQATKEAAEILGWSTAKVKIRAFRARKKMRGILEKLIQRQGGYDEITG